jgi:site-specific DNA-adenine methylase
LNFEFCLSCLCPPLPYYFCCFDNVKCRHLHPAINKEKKKERNKEIRDKRNINMVKLKRNDDKRRRKRKKEKDEIYFCIF